MLICLFMLEGLKGSISHKYLDMFFAFVLICISLLYIFFFYITKFSGLYLQRKSYRNHCDC